MQRLVITGEDWKSARTKAHEAGAVARQEQAGRTGAKALTAAAQARAAYLQACRDCGDGCGDERRGQRLIKDMSEVVAFLRDAHGQWV
jgi:hypothetical protein